MDLAVDMASCKEGLRQFFDVNLRNMRAIIVAWRRSLLYHNLFNKKCDDGSPVYRLDLMNLVDVMKIVDSNQSDLEYQTNLYNHVKNSWNTFLYEYEFTDNEAGFKLHDA
ncbi:uncharacterized protein [Battus philenor]|uniref:uncharacterized protein n=1 Tax=Battus philenor TaxID=42288 RepID=UPI0035CEC643